MRQAVGLLDQIVIFCNLNVDTNFELQGDKRVGLSAVIFSQRF